MALHLALDKARQELGPTQEGLPRSTTTRFGSSRGQRSPNRPRTNLPVPGEAGLIAQWKFRLGSAEYLQELLVIDDEGSFDGEEV
jgi:hypothetical protein